MKISNEEIYTQIVIIKDKTLRHEQVLENINKKIDQFVVHSATCDTRWKNLGIFSTLLIASGGFVLAIFKLVA